MPLSAGIRSFRGFTETSRTAPELRRRLGVLVVPEICARTGGNAGSARKDQYPPRRDLSGRRAPMAGWLCDSRRLGDAADAYPSRYWIDFQTRAEPGLRPHGPHHACCFAIALRRIRWRAILCAMKIFPLLQRVLCHPEGRQLVEFQRDVEKHLARVGNEALRHARFVEIIEKHRLLDGRHGNPREHGGPIAACPRRDRSSRGTGSPPPCLRRRARCRR